MGNSSFEVSLCISSELMSPNDIEKYLNVPVSRKSSEPESRVFVDSPLDSFDPVDKHVSFLCQTLENSMSGGKWYSKDIDITIWCVIYSESEFVGLDLNKELIKKLALLDVGLVFSFYESDSV